MTDSIRKLREYEENGTEWIELAPGQFDPLSYYKGRVMVEYLIDIRKMTYDEILSDTIMEEAVDDEMQEWYGDQLAE